MCATEPVRVTLCRAADILLIGVCDRVATVALSEQVVG